MDQKERISVKANELFNRYGVRSVSMDDIASNLGISKKTVYQYYEDKEELVKEVIERVLINNKMRCTEDRKTSENAIHEIFRALDMMQEMFAKMNPVMLYDLQKYHPRVFNSFQQHKGEFMYEMIRTNLEKGIREGIYRDDLDTEVIARFRIESIFLPFNPEVFPNNRTHLVHIELQIADHFLYGIANAKGQKLIQKYKKQRTKN